MAKIRDKTIAKLAEQASKSSSSRISTDEVPNLDAMGDNELRTFVDANKSKPGNTWAWIRTYAGMKADSISAREAGNIRLASHIEHELDNIYSYIPKHLRW